DAVQARHQPPFVDDAPRVLPYRRAQAIRHRQRLHLLDALPVPVERALGIISALKRRLRTEDPYPRALAAQRRAGEHAPTTAWRDHRIEPLLSPPRRRPRSLGPQEPFPRGRLLISHHGSNLLLERQPHGALPEQDVRV